MSDIKDWLELHGLLEYESLFRQHRIDLDTLSSITEDDLKELAIPLGDRKKILKAISAYLRWNAGDNNSSRPVRLADSERRLLVVLFCDMVDSTRYATHLDPEDLADILGNYQETVREIIESHHGLTMIYEGDGIKAYFGSRVASEDDQEQALTAAMEIVEKVSHMNVEHTKNLEVRIGISTGTVLIGDFDSPTGPNAFGEPMHLAARLQALAEPGSILVDQATRKSMVYMFDFEDQGSHSLKGYDDKVRAWKVIGKKKIDSRFAKRFRHTGMVGRQREIDTLVHHWRNASERQHSSLVLITGEAGIGKSRLAHELQQLVDRERSRSLLFQCSPYHTDSIYYPVLETIGAELGLNDKIDKGEKKARLAEFLKDCDVPVEQSLPVFNNLFSMDAPGSRLDSDLSESLQEDISKRVLAAYLLGLCGQSPLLVLVEDIQWIDASSLSFLEYLSARSENYPLLIVLTSRLSGLPGLQKIDLIRMELNRLTTDESLRLVSDLFSGRAVPAEFQGYIERKAEGIPLFIEELSSTILDTGLKDSDPELADENTDGFGMSGILQSSLLSKLDRLGETKEVALLAATIGREFDFEVLQGIARLSSSSLRESLERLMDAGIIFETTNPAANSYYFKHALIQDTAINLLSRERKESAHRKIAEVLAQGIPGRTSAEPELIAYHFAQGRDFARAAEYWYTAGSRAAKTWAKKEALQFMQNGMEALFKTPESGSRLRSELGFQLEIGDILYAAYGYITRQGESAYLRAQELCELLNDHESLVRALDGLFGMHFNSCHFDATMSISDRLITLGEEHDNISALVLGMQFKGMSLFCKGEFPAADELLTRALTYIGRSDEVGSDFPSMALIYLSWTRFIRDQTETAIDCYSEALSIVQVQSPYRKAACLGDGCILYAFMGKPEQVNRLVAELIPLGERYGFNLWLNIARFFKGWSESCGGDPEGLKAMEKMMVSLGGQEIDKTMYLGLLASAYLDYKEYELAADAIESGLSQIEATGETYYSAEILRLKAKLLAQSGGDTQASRSLLEQAIACANRQSATSWLNRAERDLKRYSTQVR